MIFDHNDAIHLCPLPMSVPVPSFKDLTVAFTLISSQVDELIFFKLTELYGIKNKFKE